MLKSTQNNPDKLERAVMTFANAMLSKLRKKGFEGYTGWNDDLWMEDEEHRLPGKVTPPEWLERMSVHHGKMIYNKCRNEDMIDVANFLMMRHAYNLRREANEC